MAYSLRLIEDRLAANAAAPVSRASRVLYAVEGALLADGAAEPAPAVGPGADRAARPPRPRRASTGSSWCGSRRRPRAGASCSSIRSTSPAARAG